MVKETWERVFMYNLNRKVSLIFVILISLTILVSCSSSVTGSLDYLQITGNRYHYMIPTTDVKDQQRTGTCWAYNSLSFFESEAMRMGTADDTINLSEMYVVYHTYLEKASMYLDMMGENPFTEGGQDYDTTMVIRKYGIVRESDYNAKNRGYHEKIVNEMKSQLDKTLSEYTETETLPAEAKQEAMDVIKSILDKRFGEVPQSMSLNGTEITPIEYARDVLSIDVSKYITLTSFTHLPKNEYVELELPDNWQHYNQYINISLPEMVEIVKNSIRMAYSVSYSADVTEPDIDWQNGYLILDDDRDIEDLSYSEMASLRQTYFEVGETTDDHGMHIVGMYESEVEGEDWFYLKNSWGRQIGEDGYIHMSEDYFKIKTIAVMVHEDVFTDFEYLLPYFWE
jgi:bleomycin hydrolase